MAKVGVSLKIDVTKIDKKRLFSGKKGTYLDATVFIDIDQLDQYGNSGMITQDVAKEEKDQGVKGNILGNCKVFWSDQPQQQPQQQYAPPQQQQAPQTPQGVYAQQAPQQGYQQQAPAPQHAPLQQTPAGMAPPPPMGSFDSDIPF